MAENIIVPYQRSRQKVDKEESGDPKHSGAKGKKDWKAHTDTDLFLLGKTGNGKSATGNSILMRQVFESSDSTTSVTTAVDFDYIDFNGRIIKVVDVRGVQDTRETTAKATALFIREMEYAVVANPRGYHAFLIVLRYSIRFTTEEVETIKFLKAVFGETFVKDHCIIVMTGGDMFFIEHGSNGLSFKNWCDKQQGHFKELLQESSNRIVLLNNRSKDEVEKKKQVTDLLNLVDQLEGTRYTDDKFKQANSAQIELIMKSEVADLREDALLETSLILQKLKSCQESLSDEQEALEFLLDRTEAFMQNFVGLDKKTKLLQDLIDNIAALKSNISLEIKVHVDIKEWRNSFKDVQEKMETKTASQKEKITSQYSKSTETCSDDDKIRLLKERDKKIEDCDKKLEQEMKAKESEFYREINKRREKIKLERQKQEEKFRETKSMYIHTFLEIFLNLLGDMFQAILNRFCNISRIGYRAT